MEALRVLDGQKGFFKELFGDLRNGVDEEKLNRFGSLRNDEERVKFVFEEILCGKSLALKWTSYEKNAEEALMLKNLGNKAFLQEEDSKAAELYTQSIIKMPLQTGSGSELAVIVANRSAALYRMKEYELAVNDVNEGLRLGYPKEKEFKILERKAKCLLAMRKHKKAIEQFQKTITALDYADMPREKKTKMQTDIQIMLQLLSRADDSAAKHSKSETQSEEILCSSRHPVYTAGCDKIAIVKNPEVGRQAVAAADISPGEVLLMERPHCSVLLAESSLSHCLHCFSRSPAPLPCKTCSGVVFCSERCRKAAEKSYHRYECPILHTVHSSGASVMVLMALRAITQKPISFFLGIRDSLQKDDEEKDRTYDGSDYKCLYNLVRHQDMRKRDDFFERTVMALFLVECLRRAKYFDDPGEGKKCLSDEESLLGGLMLRHLQLLQFNAHEIFETEIAIGGKFQDARTVFVGGGIYPTLSLFNHSCDPGVVRYFRGTTVVVRAVKPIRKDEVIAENYGPVFTSAKIEERRAKLRSQYWFECNCVACVENWPTFDEMDAGILKFRCDPGGSLKSCGNVIPVPQSTDEFAVKCSSCGHLTNLLKGLKALQETDGMYRQASKDADAGNYEAALGIYLEVLGMLDAVMVPPFRDYHLCQQAIRTCMICLGNKVTSAPSKK